MQYNRDKEFDAIRFKHRPQIKKQLLPKTSSIVNLLAMPRPLISIHCLEGTLQSSWLTHIQGPSNDYSRPSAKIAYVSWPGGYPPIIADFARIHRGQMVCTMHESSGGEAIVESQTTTTPFRHSVPRNPSRTRK